jgi:hypothetical protein
MKRYSEETSSQLIDLSTNTLPPFVLPEIKDSGPIVDVLVEVRSDMRHMWSHVKDCCGMAVFPRLDYILAHRNGTNLVTTPIGCGHPADDSVKALGVCTRG